MTITAYRPLSASEPTFPKAKVTDIFVCTSYSYHRYWYQVGNFTLVVPANVPTVDLITEDMILSVDGRDSLIVTDISRTEKEYTFKGYDLKYLLHLRLTLFPQKEQDAGTYGYYVVQGSTEYCIKDMIQYNITAAADEERRIYGFYAAANQNRGLENDTYMTRLELLDEVVAAMCKNAQIGYDIKLDFANNRYLFDVALPVDKTDSQHDINSIVFAKQFCNVIGLKRETGTSSEKNAIYAINGGGTADKVVKCVLRDKSDVPAGILRREVTVNTSAELATEVDMYALKEAEDYVKTDSFELDTAAILEYGKLFSVGDKVTFKHGNLYLDSIILEAQIDYTGNDKKVTLTAGNKKPKALNTIGNKTGTLEGNVNAVRIDNMSEKGVLPLSQFVANADGSYTVNGVTYIPCFGSNGKISNIIDDKGNSIVSSTSYAEVNDTIDFNTFFMSVTASMGIETQRSADCSIYEIEITSIENYANVVPVGRISMLSCLGTVDWGDGIIDEFDPYNGISHTYSEIGVYFVKITAPIKILCDGFSKDMFRKKLIGVALSNNIEELRSSKSDSVFQSCFKMKYFRGGKNLKTIGKSSFASCLALESVFFPDNNIIFEGGGTFQACEKLKKIIVPHTSEIPDHFISLIRGEFTIFIPKDVQTICSYAFNPITNMENEAVGSMIINFEGTEAEWDAVTKGENWCYCTNISDYIKVNYNQKYRRQK